MRGAQTFCEQLVERELLARLRDDSALISTDTQLVFRARANALEQPAPRAR
jgi:hypothetical protein